MKCCLVFWAQEGFRAVEMVSFVPQERVPQRISEQQVEVPVSQIMDAIEAFQVQVQVHARMRRGAARGCRRVAVGNFASGAHPRTHRQPGSGYPSAFGLLLAPLVHAGGVWPRRPPWSFPRMPAWSAKRTD